MDAEQFRSSVEALASRVYSHAAYLLRDREEARDIVQETFVRMWRHCDQIDGEHAARAWALKTAHNLAFDRMRGRVNGTPVDLELAAEIASPEIAADVSLARRELRGQIDSALAGMSPTDRAILGDEHHHTTAHHRSA